MDILNTIYGVFNGPYFGYYILISVALALFFGFRAFPLWLWTALLAVVLVGFGAPAWLLVVFAGVALVFNVRLIRRVVLSLPILRLMKKLEFLPQISQTERVALEAGVVWVESDLFSGKPDFEKINQEPYPHLTAEEQAFLDGPVEEFCGLVKDWDVWKTKDLPPEAWAYLKKHKFLGMIIPREYGGLGFSATAHSEVIEKVASRSIPVGVTIMVPNSLGPAELLVHYGTEEQRKKYLPRLASGELIPCFALTEPTAGSDAGSIQAEGTLFKNPEGKLCVRLNWNKRWITLAAISNILGLAFRMKDPDNLLGRGEDLGITCALIPTDTKGVIIGRRHDPLGVPFYNCPTQGKDVVVPIDAVVGGLEGVGEGWKMLMECLSAGRGISLPGQTTGSVKFIARVASNHGIIRKQFGMSIGKFEGIEEPLARIAGFTYLIEAFRRFTLGALDKGIKPPVITAIAKYQTTELGRQCINDGMDILGGSGISRGPRNLLANLYISTPIGITVEGANIMTRTLIIFGQGALRAHPFAYKELTALEKNDIKGFDRAFWGHIGHVINNLFRVTLLSLSRGHLASGVTGGPVGRYYKKLAWISATFALLADIAMASLGGKLKQKEKITGRFADILSWMYMLTSVLRRYEADGRRSEDLPFVQFAMKYGFTQIQNAFNGIFSNIKVPGLTWLFRGPLQIINGLNSVAEAVNDKLTQQLCALMLQDSEQRDRVTAGIYIPSDVNDALGRQEHAFKIVLKAEAAERKIRKAVREKVIPKIKGPEQVEVAHQKGVITDDERRIINESTAVRLNAIQVDDFSQDEYMAGPTQSTKHALHKIS